MVSDVCFAFIINKLQQLLRFVLCRSLFYDLPWPPVAGIKFPISRVLKTEPSNVSWVLFRIPLFLRGWFLCWI